MSKETTAITVQTPEYLSLAEKDIGAMMAEELGGLQLSFDRVKVPSAGATAYQLPDDNGKIEHVSEFSAVILFQHALNAHYKTPFNGGHNPPDCGSFDGITGIGDPGGDCQACPLNQFDSGANGAKACQNRRRLYILREGTYIPMLMSLPKGSIKNFTDYLKLLISKGRRPREVVTRFSLVPSTNKNGVLYSQAKFSIDRVLKSEECTLLKDLSDQVMKYSSRMSFDCDAPAVGDSSDSMLIDPETGEVVNV